MNLMFPVILTVAALGFLSGNLANECVDYKGNEVGDWQQYRPNDNPCVLCMCYGKKKHKLYCRTETCSKPTCENFVPSKEKCCEYTCVSNSTTETSSDFNNLPNLRQKRSSNELSYVPDKNMFQLVELPKNLKEIIIFVKDKWKKIREFFKNLKK